MHESSDGNFSNMLTITFATRTDSTLDPLTKRALELNNEFMALTGELQFQFHLSWQVS
jgi:hypothetical protein